MAKKWSDYMFRSSGVSQQHLRKSPSSPPPAQADNQPQRKPRVPPRKMQDGNDDFRHYMSRKIELQRGQFGLVLPPPPPEEEDDNNNDKRRTGAPLSSSSSSSSSFLTGLVERLQDRHGTISKRRKGRSRRSSRNKEKDDEESKVEKLPPPERTALDNDNHNNNNSNDENDTEDLVGEVRNHEKSRSDTETPRPDLFLRGVVVIINGFTTPDDCSLMRLLHRHGGDVERYETSRVTHMIADQLSSARAKFIMKKQRQLPVVRAQWIVDCVAARRQLATAPYRLSLQDCWRQEGGGGGAGNGETTHRLTRFFGAPAPTTTTSTATTTTTWGTEKNDDDTVLKKRKQRFDSLDESHQNVTTDTAVPLEQPLFQHENDNDHDDDEDDLFLPATQAPILHNDTHNNDKGNHRDPQTKDGPGISPLVEEIAMEEHDKAVLSPATEKDKDQEQGQEMEPTTEKKQKKKHPELPKSTLYTPTPIDPRKHKCRAAGPSMDGGTTRYNHDHHENNGDNNDNDGNRDDVKTRNRDIQEEKEEEKEMCKEKHSPPAPSREDSHDRDTAAATIQQQQQQHQQHPQHDKTSTREKESLGDTESAKKKLFFQTHTGDDEHSREASLLQQQQQDMLTKASDVCGSQPAMENATNCDARMAKGEENATTSTTASTTTTTTIPEPSTTTESTTTTNSNLSIKLPNGQVRTVGTDPNFLESYFSHSRLSFIGSYKQRIKQATAPSSSSRRPNSATTTQFVFHVDMDCFFASVVLRKYPQYQNHPVAIGHSWRRNQAAPSTATKKSYSELSTCNYAARARGVTKGMFLHRARQLCPELVVLPYDFDGYEQVSSQVSEILHRHAEACGGAVEEVSCDESYLQVFLEEAPAVTAAQRLAETIRGEIVQATKGCTATIGVGPNKFLSKLATDQVKPNGSLVISADRWSDFLGDLPLGDLPGIGHVLQRKLRQQSRLQTVRDVWELPSRERAKVELFAVLGRGLGQKTLDFVLDGKDDRPVQAAPRKTIGAVCNYGVRFDGPYGIDYMIMGLAKEVQRRMEGVQVVGKRLTLKVRQRKEGAGEPAKFNGCGACDEHSKSADLPVSKPTRDAAKMARVALHLFEQLAIPLQDVRGVGIIMSKLTTTTQQRQGETKSEAETEKQDVLSSWLCGGPKNVATETTREKMGDETAIQEGHDSTGTTTTTTMTTATTMATTMEESLATNDNSCEKQPSTTAVQQDCFGGVQGAGEDDVSVRQEVMSVEPAKDEDDDDDVIVVGSTTAKRQGDRRRHPVEQVVECVSSAPSTPQVLLSSSEIVLPPISQIDREQVNSLPLPLRNDVLGRIEALERGQRSTSSHSPSSPQKKKRRQRASSPSPSPPLSPRRRRHKRPQPNLDNPEYQQASVKRMLKLASVKAGKETLESGNDKVSVTQLECLPLELQLQIANNDQLSIGKRSPRRAIKFREVGPDAVMSSPMRCTPEKTHEKGSPDSCQSMEAPSLPDVAQEEDNRNAEPKVILTRRSFYHENIAPLMEWMDERSCPTDEDRNVALAFFSAVVREKRLDELVKMLRSVRHRGDSWGGTTYDRLLAEVNFVVQQTEGKPLDLEHLGLLPLR